MTDVAVALSDPADTSTIAPMRRGRVAIVLLLAAFILGGHLYDIYTQREHWPFSFYPMYGRVQKKPRLQVLTLVLLTRDADGKRHLMRITDNRFVPPLGESRIRNILMTAWGRDGSDPRAERNVVEVLRAYLGHYEANRVRGLHDGPQALEAQMCLMTWRVKPDGSGQKPRSLETLLVLRAKDGRVFNYAAARAKAGDDAPSTAATTSKIEGDTKPPPADPDDVTGD